MTDYKDVMEANREYHNHHAKDYDKATMKGNFQRVEDVFDENKGGAFLDLGCGTGEQLKIAKKYFDPVYGIDCSEGMLAIAEKVTPNLTLGDVGELPYEDEKFDFINCFSVLHHLYDQEPAIKEAFRVLKKGGVFYSDNDSNSEFYKWFSWWLTFRRKFLRTKHKYLDGKWEDIEKVAEYHQKKGLDPIKLKKQFEDAGFWKVRIIYHYPEHPDTFTKILKFKNKFLKSKALYYYFSIIATK